MLETPRHQLALYAAGALLVLLLGALYLGREDGAVPSAPPPRAGGGAPAIDADRFEPAGERRGGVADALDSVRRRAERGLQRGLPAPEAALARGVVLGQDERLADDVRDDFQRAGLAHLLSVRR